MFSERELDGISRSDELFFRRANSKNPAKGGAEKNRIWQKKEKLLDLRKSWEVEQNLVLEKYGLEIRVDCRSLQEMRREALEKENFQRAEELDRTPINISGKILYKVDHKMRLTEEEEKKYQTFLRAKEEKR
ncbi:MobA/MobL family protein [Fusobacterium necrophorum]|uniref:MobA/MobL family protein n=1 Tax=Fusobacterium necrophorum TaxID=859 RepID=UPI0003A5379A|nr:MobA/MobL family protein [Fusobacterium necrophorum]